MPESATLEDRLRTIEDTLAIYALLATHPISADTGEPELIEGIYTEDFVFDRGPGLAGAQGVSAMVDLVGNAAHHAAIAGGLAHFGSLPLIELDGDTATATSYLALITPITAVPSVNCPITGRPPGSGSIACSPIDGRSPARTAGGGSASAPSCRWTAGARARRRGAQGESLLLDPQQLPVTFVTIRCVKAFREGTYRRRRKGGVRWTNSRKTTNFSISAT